MAKTNNRLREIFDRYLGEHASEEEKHELWDYIEDPVFASEIDGLLGQDYERVHNELGLSEGEQAMVLQQIFAVKTPQKPATVRIWTRIAAAASILLIASLGFYFYKSSLSRDSENKITYQHDVAPGGNGATLTLANGQTVSINEALAGNIANQTGVIISKTPDGQIRYELTGAISDIAQYNTLSTAEGQQAQVRLQDGTMVYMNAGSTLRYPTSFVHMKQRNVSLTGEGYFEVARDVAKPFIVKSGGQEVQVLGTHFNINAYADEPAVKTTLIEGSVRVVHAKGTGMLKPGQQASLLSDGKLEIGQANTELATAWKNNTFMFEGQSIAAIMRMAARWYDVEVVYDGPIPNDRYTGEVPKFDHISKLLTVLESSGGVHFKITKERVIHVSK